MWNWLPATHFVAELGSIREAARVLGVSPSAVSRMVKLVEETIDIQIFVRGPNRIVLTSAGESFVTKIRQGLSVLFDAVA